MLEVLLPGMKDEMRKEIIWQAPEFKYRPKDVGWYWMSIAGASVLFLLAIWQRNFLFGIFVVLAEIMVISFANKFPKVLQFKINKSGVHISTIKLYAYDDLEGFHILEHDDGTGELVLKTKNKLHPFVKMFVVQKDISNIKEFLQSYLQEVEYKEPITDRIGDLIGF